MKAKKFHSFRRFSPVLRLKIWKLSLPGPRFVEMRMSAIQQHQQYDFVTKENDFTYSGSTPTLLHVCQESRKEALRYYTLAFHNRKCSIPVYFDFDIDTLYLRDPRAHSAQIRAILKNLPNKNKVQNMAVTRGLGVELNSESDFPYLLNFSGLKEVFVLHTLSREQSASRIM